MIDEIGFVPLHKDAAELLFQVISDCYERKSLIITSNLEFSPWNTVLGDNRLTAALVDRLIHHSHIVIFSGESYRLTQSMNRQRNSFEKERWGSAHTILKSILGVGGAHLFDALLQDFSIDKHSRPSYPYSFQII